DDDAHDEHFAAKQEIHEGEEEHDEVDPEVIAAAGTHEEDLSELGSNDHVVAELSAEQAAAHAQNVAEMQIAHGVVDEAEDEAESEDELANFAAAELADAEADAEAAHEEATEAEEGDDESSEASGEVDAEAEVRESLLAYDTGD